MGYIYTQQWFNKSEVKRNLFKHIDFNEQRILEIGCYEGLSSVFFADHCIDHPRSTLTCVDPFLRADNDHAPLLQNNEEERFDVNMTLCKHREKIGIHKITSDEFFEKNRLTYTFIYIDGSHEVEFIQRDMENSFRVLEKNGVMWMDDYLGGDGIQIRRTMDAFVEKYKDKLMVIHREYQLAIRKL